MNAHDLVIGKSYQWLYGVEQEVRSGKYIGISAIAKRAIMEDIDGQLASVNPENIVAEAAARQRVSGFLVQGIKDGDWIFFTEAKYAQIAEEIFCAVRIDQEYGETVSLAARHAA